MRGGKQLGFYLFGFGHLYPRIFAEGKQCRFVIAEIGVFGKLRVACVIQYNVRYGIVRNDIPDIFRHFAAEFGVCGGIEAVGEYGVILVGIRHPVRAGNSGVFAVKHAYAHIDLYSVIRCALDKAFQRVKALRIAAHGVFPAARIWDAGAVAVYYIYCKRVQTGALRRL